MTIAIQESGRTKYAWEKWDLADGHTLSMIAKDVRQEHTGIHAQITIGLDKNRLETSVFNIGRLESRTSLGNAAWKQLQATPGQGYGVTQEVLKKRLTTFCQDLWAAWVGPLKTTMLSGTLDIKPAEWYLRPYVLQKGITFLYGPQGRGKSYLLMLMGIALDAAGEDGLITPWRLAQPRRVAYVNLERSDQSMAARLGRVNQVSGLHPNRPLRFLNARGRSMSDVIDSLAEDITAHGIEVVLWDSVSRSGVGDLNNNETGNRIVDTLGSLGVSVVAIGHTPRSDDNHMYGAVQFDQGADLMVVVKSQQASNGDLSLKLTLQKGNDTQTGQSEAFRMTFNEAGLASFTRTVEEDLPSELQSTKMLSNREAVLKALEEAELEGSPWTTKQVADAAEKAEPAVRRELSALVKDGQVVMVAGSKGRGNFARYRLRAP